MFPFIEISLWLSAFSFTYHWCLQSFKVVNSPSGERETKQPFWDPGWKKIPVFTTEKRLSTSFLKPVSAILSQHSPDNILVPSTILRWTNNGELCYSPLEIYPISQQSGSSFKGKTRQLGWHITVARTYGIFIHVHKQFLLPWVDQWVFDKWYLSSFIHWLRIHGVCWIGKNKSIFKQPKTLDKVPSLSLPLFHLLAFAAIWSNPSQSGIPAYSQSQGGLFE